jgi:hypothetical protein
MIMNTLMAYYLVRQKYWLYMLLEMMSIKGETDFSHNIVILFSNQFKSPQQIKGKIPGVRLPILSSWQKRMMPG